MVENLNTENEVNILSRCHLEYRRFCAIIRIFIQHNILQQNKKIATAFRNLQPLTLVISLTNYTEDRVLHSPNGYEHHIYDDQRHLFFALIFI